MVDIFTIQSEKFDLVFWHLASEKALDIFFEHV